MFSLITTTESQPWQRTALPVRTPMPGADLAITGERRQNWEGFGGCFNELGWIALGHLSETDRDCVMRSLFDPREGCRFNFCRLPIGASDYAAEWYSHNEQEGDLAMRHHSIERDERHLIPYIRAASAIRPDLTFFASPWSPPTWMKFPKAYNHGTMIWKPEILDAYALYFVKFVQAYQAAGIRISQVHPQNEPIADQKFPSCVWTGPQLRDFIRDHLAPAFRKYNIDAEIWLGTLNTDDYDGYVHTVLSDPETTPLVAGVGFQWMGKGAIGRTHASFPEKRIIQTENECGDGKNTWAYAGYVFNLIQHYVANGANAYVYWNMVLATGGGLSTWGWAQNAMISIDPVRRCAVFNPEFYVMKHFSALVDPGATVMGLRGAWAGNALAFANPDGKLVLVVHNHYDASRTLRVNGPCGAAVVTLPPRSFNSLVLSQFQQ